MSVLFDGKPALGWLRSAIVFGLAGLTMLSCLSIAWSSDGPRLGVTIVELGLAVSPRC